MSDPLAIIRAEIENIKAEAAAKEAAAEAARKALQNEQDAILTDGLRQIFEAVGIDSIPTEPLAQIGEYSFRLSPARSGWAGVIERNYFCLTISTSQAIADDFEINLNFGNPEGDIDVPKLRRNIALAFLQIEHKTQLAIREEVELSDRIECED